MGSLRSKRPGIVLHVLLSIVICFRFPERIETGKPALVWRLAQENLAAMVTIGHIYSIMAYNRVFVTLMSKKQEKLHSVPGKKYFLVLYLHFFWIFKGYEYISNVKGFACIQNSNLIVTPIIKTKP